MNENENIIKIESNRLQNFPVMMFAIVMGLTGLALAFQKAEHILYLPSWPFKLTMHGKPSKG